MFGGKFSSLLGISRRIPIDRTNFQPKSVRVKRLVGSLFLRFGIRLNFCFFVLLLRLNLNDKDVVGRSASSIKHLFPGASNGSRRPAFQGKERPNRGIEEI